MAILYGNASAVMANDGDVDVLGCPDFTDRLPSGIRFLHLASAYLYQYQIIAVTDRSFPGAFCFPHNPRQCRSLAAVHRNLPTTVSLFSCHAREYMAAPPVPDDQSLLRQHHCSVDFYTPCAIGITGSVDAKSAFCQKPGIAAVVLGL